MTSKEKAIAKDAIVFLIFLLKRRGIEEGCEADYDGGSYADDLRGLARLFEIDIPKRAPEGK